MNDGIIIILEKETGAVRFEKTIPTLNTALSFSCFSKIF